MNDPRVEIYIAPILQYTLTHNGTADGEFITVCSFNNSYAILNVPNRNFNVSLSAENSIGKGPSTSITICKLSILSIQFN